MKFLKTNSYRKGIFFSTSFNMLSKLLLFSQNIVLAFYFGTQAKVDIYFYCFTTISLISAFITLLNSTIIIPESMRIRSQVSDLDSKRFLNIFIYGYLSVGLVVSSILLIFPVDSFLLLSKFNRELLIEYKGLLLFSIPLFTLMIVEYLLADIISSYKYFTVPQIAKMINSVFGLIFLLIFHNILDVKSIFLGLIAGYSINILFLVRIMYHDIHWSFKFKSYKIERRVIINSIYSQAANLMATLSQYIPMFLLSGLGSGVISALNYGQRTSNLPTNSITQQFSPIAGIKFNELYSASKYSELNKIFINTTSILIFVLIPVSGVFYLLADEIIIFLYNRGAFDMNSVTLSAKFLQLLGLSIPLVALNNIVTRLFNAGLKLRPYFFYQATKSVVFIISVYFTINKYGALAFPITWLVIQIINMFGYYLILSKHFDFIRYTSVITEFFKYFILNVAIVLVLLITKDKLQGLHVFVVLICVGTLYTLLLVSFNYMLKINAEVNQYLHKFLISKIKKNG